MTASLERAGIDRRRLEAMTDSIRTHAELNVHAVLIERHGRLVYEEYFSGKDERWGQPLGVVVFTRETKHDLRSVTKSIVSASLESQTARAPFVRSILRFLTTSPSTRTSRSLSDGSSPFGMPSR